MVERSALIAAIEEDFKQRLPDYHKSRREALTTLAGVMLETRSANLMELAAALPREIGAADHRYQYIERQLKNEAIDAGVMIKPYALAAIERLAARGQTVVLQMDQSHINDANEVLMPSARLRMFSDFKSRGFGLMQSHIQKPDRLERLILIMSITLNWAISCGMFAERQAVADGVKKGL